ncbi:hypothetical protein TVAG_185800 [Trichomonas vaginalis G3]|uniref:Uncharacterized protein n=1 Tax=Trichomonas vaginalis (strain ATCC PRA-98 / G3) TaxID=412133 RepID=A2D8M4_TRIV3|nr:hypothetical protein TVAG_185800 [Trichomonas vaginalis G3]|eukprot:XP_001584259.1 hypothetical protein [Trichomonas vaginalis G3]
MFPGSRSKALAKEQERQRQLQEQEEREKLHADICKYIEEDDLDKLKEYVPSVVPIDEVFQEFFFLFWHLLIRGKA